MLLENNLTFTKYVPRKYDDKFAVEGAKINATINLRTAAQFRVSDGPNLDLQNFVEGSVPFTINKQKHVDVSFSSVELTLSMQDFSERVLAPQMIMLANQIDADGLAQWPLIYNSVGVPGVANTTAAAYLAAGVILDNNSVPRDPSKRSIVLSPQGQADAVSGFQAYFNDQDTIGKQYLNGTMGRAFGFRWSMDQNVGAMQVGPLGGAPAVNGAGQVGTTLVTNAWTAAAASRLLGGEIFTMAGVYNVNPISKISTGKLQQFTVVGPVSSDGAGNATLTISPSIIVAGSTQTVSAAPANGALLSFVGAANSITPQGLAFHPDAFCFASVDLEDVSRYGAWGARVSDKQLGISMRVARQYSIGSDTVPTRIN